MTLPSISNAYRSTIGYVRDHTATPSQMARNAAKIAPIAVPLIAMSMIPGAEGGFWKATACGVCWAGCLVANFGLENPNIDCSAVCSAVCR